MKANRDGKKLLIPPKKRGTLVLGELFPDFAMVEMKNKQFAIIRGDAQLMGYFMGELDYATDFTQYDEPEDT